MEFSTSAQGYTTQSVMSSIATSSIYNGFTTQVLIPFVSNAANSPIPFTEKVRVAITIGSGTDSKDLSPSIDTGTCGFVLSTNSFPRWPPANLSDYPVGWEFLSSSKKLYSGHWIPQDVSFRQAGVQVKSQIPILAVEDTVICPHYQATDKNVCPTPVGEEPPAVTHLPERISLFGVGFGRQHDGQPQGNPDKNAFLNIVSINNTPTASDTKFRNGYIITREGIIIGLTESNTAGYSFSELNEGMHHATHPLDWQPVSACIAVDPMASCVEGTALIDTGITHSYLTLPLDSPIHRHDTESPSSKALVKALDDGSVVHITFGTGVNSVEDTFTVVNSTNTMITDHTPDMIITTLSAPAVKPPFINTGTHFLRTWNVAFDAGGGRFGLKRV